jgi:hypothetical protein
MLGASCANGAKESGGGLRMSLSVSFIYHFPSGRSINFLQCCVIFDFIGKKPNAGFGRCPTLSVFPYAGYCF